MSIIANVNRESALGEPRDASSPDAHPTPVNILLVDDDQRNLAALEAILESPGYRLIRAQSADDALRAIMIHDFALLILDVQMPDVNGIELAKLIKERKKTRHIPIIFLTAYLQEDEHALKGYGAGAVDYIAKPFNTAVLRSKVAVFVELYRTNRALQDEIAARGDTERRLALRTSEVQQLVTQLRALALELTRAEHRERRRLAKVLHDHMQQLLVSAKMQLFLVAQSSAPERTPEFLKNIRSALDEAITVSRSVTVDLSPPVLDRAGFVAALEWLAGQLKEKNEFNVNIHADGYIEPSGEEERLLLFECTRELIFNAIKHSGASEVDVTVSLTRDQRTKIVVGDTGNGFDKYRLTATTETKGSFGLFSVQQRLAHLGGEVMIETAPGKGTRITILAPESNTAVLEEDILETETMPAEDLKCRIDPAITLLIVDDHTIVRQSLANLLGTQSGIHIVGEAGTRDDAVRLADELRPDVILMDINLGSESGLEATRTILAKNPTIKVIGLSMYNENELGAAMRLVGAVAYVNKNVAAEELVSIIRSV